MIYLLAALVVVLIVKDAWLSRRRDTENDAWRLLLADETAAHRQETADLIQRCQAPELAVMRHEVTQATEQPGTGGAPPMTDEDYLRDHQEVAEYIARIEAMENERLGV